MAFRFDPASFRRAVLLFLVLVLLASFGRNLGWVRSFFGDVLAVAWVYYVIRTLVRTKPVTAAAIAFACGAAVELTQYVLTRIDVQISNRLLRIVFGATPDWWDIVAYGMGAALVLVLECLPNRKKAR